MLQAGAGAAISPGALDAEAGDRTHKVFLVPGFGVWNVASMQVVRSRTAGSLGASGISLSV